MAVDDIPIKCGFIGLSNYVNVIYKDISAQDYYRDGLDGKSEVSHYCNISVLKNILESRKLRFSDVGYLNDSTEFIEAITVVENVIKEGLYNDEFKKICLDTELVDDLLNYNQRQIEYSTECGIKDFQYRMYTFSMSEANNDYLWKNYTDGRSGISICFDDADNIFDGEKEVYAKRYGSIKLKDGIVLWHGKVVYDYMTKKRCLKSLIDDIYEIYKEATTQIDDFRPYIVSAYKEALNNTRCFMKNDYFRNEKEYRFVAKVPVYLIGQYNLDNDRGKKQWKIGTFPRNNLMVPYLDYEFNNNSLSYIIMNPYIIEKDSLFERSVHDICLLLGFSDVKVKKSNIIFL